MLRSTKTLLNYDLQAIDGQIGRVHDFYFDDQQWHIRYLVADTGKWLPGRKVLIAPESLGTPNWDEETFPVLLTKEAVENSPSINEEMPVSRQHEWALSQYYEWNPYWRGMAANIHMPTNIHHPVNPALSRPPAPETTEEIKAIAQQEQKADQHLRSMREVTEYYIRATDGTIGHVEAFIINDQNWRIQYLVIDTRNWLPGKKVLISPTWIDTVDWGATEVVVDLPRKMIKDSPEYDPSQPVSRAYETVLFDYYGRPHYWKESGELERII